MPKTQLQQEWETRIRDFKTSGLSVKDWCAANEVKPHQSRNWKLSYWMAGWKSITTEVNLR